MGVLVACGDEPAMMSPNESFPVTLIRLRVLAAPELQR